MRLPHMCPLTGAWHPPDTGRAAQGWQHTALANGPTSPSALASLPPQCDRCYSATTDSVVLPELCGPGHSAPYFLLIPKENKTA